MGAGVMKETWPVLFYVLEELRKIEGYQNVTYDQNYTYVQVKISNRYFDIRMKMGTICLYEYSCLIWYLDINQ